ncbi:hypothetical protein ABZX90_42765 [Streptomyces sp. NPDC002935]|uniref:hypothetical protein n=1 Tax=unclassified Streptomyces TaxID=2593676 RepID=UPI0033252D2D
MSGDMGDASGPKKRPRRLGRAQVSWPPALGKLKDLLYEVYLAAGAPSLDEIVKDVAADDELPGSPGRDTVRLGFRVGGAVTRSARCCWFDVGLPSGPGGRADAFSVGEMS